MIPPVIVLLVSGVLPLFHRKLDTKIYLATSLVLLLFPPQQYFAVLWVPLSRILATGWPKLLALVVSSSDLHNYNTIIHGGPLGKGCSKLCHVIVAYVLWYMVYWEIPQIDVFKVPNEMHGGLFFIILFVLSVVVNLVLWLWSKLVHSVGNHKGVNEMVEQSVGRNLVVVEQLRILSSAFINALCEEIIYRGFWLLLFQTVPILYSYHTSNIIQAILFGCAHYDGGVPDGISGVFLTFIYGIIMGILANMYVSGHSLLLPTIAHTIADYFIFSYIVRQQDIRKKSTKKRQTKSV